jgi:hypothetical protein
MQRNHTLDWAQQIHTTIWYRDLDHSHLSKRLPESAFTFHEKEEFVQHMSSAHENFLTRMQLLARTGRNKVAKIRDPFTCPFCDCSPNDVVANMLEKPYDLLANHIARHLKVLAFHSLSYLDTDGSVSESSDGNGQGVKHDDALSSLISGGSLDDNTDLDQSFNENDIPETLVEGLQRRVEEHTFEDPSELDSALT